MIPTLSDPSLHVCSAVALSRSLVAREISSRDVVEAALDRIGEVNPIYNAVVSLRDRDRLLHEAAARDDALVARGEPVGPLHGLPHAVKDTALVAGMRTTFGSSLEAEAGGVGTVDAIFVERLRAAGVVIIGRTNVPERGLGSHTYNPVFGATGNAFDPTRSAGGSSGGAAVALAQRMVPLADGSDYMGSLRNPAGWNGVVSLRPTIGVVPLGPSTEGFLGHLVTEGPMARSIDDLALLLSVMAGADDRVPLARTVDPGRFAPPIDPHLDGVRFGWLGDVVDELPIEPGVVEVCRRALTTIEGAGGRVDDAALAFDRDRRWASFLTLRHFTVAGSASEGPLAVALAQPGAGDRMKPELRWEIGGGRDLGAHEVYRASVERGRLHRRFVELFESFDVLVLPTAQCFPFPIEWDWPREIAGVAMDTYHRWMEVAVPATLVGSPVLTVPAGLGRLGLPMGLQLIGRHGADLDLLRIGAAIEVAVGGWAQAPR